MVTVHCNHVDDQDPSAHDDSMMATNQRIWGFETNFGGLAEIAVVKANQLMPKPAHLTWEEAACNALCNSTSYRMIVSPNGSQMTQGQSVLVWGATGGIGAYAAQYVLNGGGTPVGVVSSREACRAVARDGVRGRHRPAGRGLQVLERDDTEQDPAEWLRLGKKIRELVGRDVDIVFEHPGRSTMGASVFVAKRGGMIITCAATSGFKIEYDNRYLWMNLKTLKGCHFANYREAWEANRLVCEARIHPTMSKVYPLDQTGEAASRCTTTWSKARLGVVPGARRRPRCHRRGDAREHLDQITLFRRIREADAPMDMLLTEIDHVAIAVNDLEAAIGYYRDTFGCDVEHREVVESRRRRRGVAQGRRFVRAAAHADPRRLARREVPREQGRRSPPLGYRVDDCAQALESVKAHGHRVIDEAPRPGSRGTTSRSCIRRRRSGL